MATLQKIRSMGPLLVIVIGLALFAFIAEEAMRSIQSASNESKQQVGEIYGEGISVHEFQNLVDEYTEVVKFTSGNSALNDEQLTQLRDQVWNTYVNNKLIEHEAEKLGLTVTEAEIQSIITEGTNPILMQTPFRNQETGRFDAEMLKKFLTDYEGMKSKSDQMPAEYAEYYSCLYKFWMFIEKTLRQESLAQKYQALLAKAMLSDQVVNKAAFAERTNESNIIMAAVPYSTINDKDVKVEASDLTAKYEELKERFKQNAESRDIQFIDVQVKASAADKAALDKDMAATAKSLAEGGDLAKIVRESGSTVNYSPLPVSKNYFPTDIAVQLDSMSVGQMKTPYLNAGDNTMNIIKLVGNISAPDSIQVRQIQVAGADLNAVKKTADSIMTALNQGAVFDSIAKKFNQTGEKTWITSRSYEGSTMDEENLKYIKTVTNMPVNGIEKIDFTQGCIIAQVTDRRAMINKYDVAVIKCPIEFSKDTYAKAYNDFSRFIAANPSPKDIEAKALKNGYNLQERKNLFSNEHYVGGVTNTREAMRWVFNDDTKVGSVSPRYECGDNDHMLVVILTGVHKKGYRSEESVKDYLTQEVLKDKKAAMLEQKMGNVKSIADVMKVQGSVSDTIDHVTFSNPAFVMKTGASEPMVSAVASMTQNNRFAGPFKGNAAVYALQVIGKNKSAEKYDAGKEEQQQEANNMRAISRFTNELYEKADVKDNRYLFF
ncbi:MAG: SurA N-terminal domain-containing protein [Paraprevotella sp.]|nr:SurA N-terminal domain-containing protein [Paraprevotella sp.]